MNLNEMRDEAHRIAKLKGWWETERSPLEIYALIHSEVSEAVEDARKERAPLYITDLYESNSDKIMKTPDDPNFEERSSVFKPRGELSEIADVLIRIGDYCGRKGWDLDEAVRIKMRYNEKRPHRHGGKKY